MAGGIRGRLGSGASLALASRPIPMDWQGRPGVSESSPVCRFGKGRLLELGPEFTVLLLRALAILELWFLRIMICIIQKRHFIEGGPSPVFPSGSSKCCLAPLAGKRARP
ncbi:unnamed protein product [Prorocentrum cordatum]|uniref:Uncharacterized protein n=1 Tax=Prorocentrum cordatum TaxID=2364126 RepID=A0ABN9TRW2_9DINO|nr:unnamed protein product [Polarella glacialis]